MSPPRGAANGSKAASAVIVVTGLSKNVLTPHLEEIFGEYGRVTGLDLPVFKVCEHTSQHEWQQSGCPALKIGCRMTLSRAGLC